MKKIKQFSTLPDKLFGFLFWNIAFAILIIYLFNGLLSFFGYSTATFNEEPAFGLSGFLVNLIIAPLMALLITFIIWALILFGNLMLRIAIKIFDK
jgi:hypothetical protein